MVLIVQQPRDLYTETDTMSLSAAHMKLSALRQKRLSMQEVNLG